MPAAKRGAAGYARIEVDLAAWATATRGRAVSAGQVSRWRRAGLLPAPTGVGVRRDGLPGRPPMQWTEPDLEQARALVTRLVDIAGRGTSLTRAALILADEGLPVPGQTVLDAAVLTWVQMTHQLRQQLGLAEVMADADDVDRVVRQIMASEPELVRGLGRRIPSADDDREGPGAETALFVLMAMFSGVGLDDLDEHALDTALHAMGAHGVVEGVGSVEGPRLLPGGAGDLAPVLELFNLDNQVALLRRFPAELVHASLEQSRGFGVALQDACHTKPVAAHHLAAEATLAGFEGPPGVVLRLMCWQAIRERQNREPDPSGLTTAIDRLPTGPELCP